MLWIRRRARRGSNSWYSDGHGQIRTDEGVEDEEEEEDADDDADVCGCADAMGN